MLQFSPLHNGSETRSAPYSRWISKFISCAKISVFRFKFHWSLFPRQCPLVNKSINHYWFRWWFGTQQATNSSLKQWWFTFLSHLCVTRPRAEIFSNPIEFLYVQICSEYCGTISMHFTWVIIPLGRSPWPCYVVQLWCLSHMLNSSIHVYVELFLVAIGESLVRLHVGIYDIFLNTRHSFLNIMWPCRWMPPQALHYNAPFVSAIACRPFIFYYWLNI